MNITELNTRAIVAKIIDKYKSKIEEHLGRTYKEILAENKQLKEENERLKELVKDMQDDIQNAKQSGYELGIRDGRNQIFLKAI